MSSESRINMTGGRVGPAAVGSQHERDIDLQQLIGQLARQGAPPRQYRKCTMTANVFFSSCHGGANYQTTVTRGLGSLPDTEA